MSLSKTKNPALLAGPGDEAKEKVQAALELLHKFGSAFKVDTAGFSFHPESPECDKIFGAYLKNVKHVPTYSSAKTLTSVGGRILYAATCQYVKLTPVTNLTGCTLWEHGWGQNLKCYHGEGMCRKKNEIEMAATSESGVAALKEGRGAVEINRWGRQVVKITQENYVICMEDLQSRFNQPSANSCGLSFSDSDKARSAMENATELTRSIFSQAKMDHLLFMPICCYCNYGGKMILGRQLCKLTPFSISGTEGLREEDVSPVQAVSVRHPAVFVFQCCNATGGSKGKTSCDFKISHADLLQVLNLVRKMWLEVMGYPMPIHFPRFKWSPSLRVKNALLPEGSVNEDENPFGLDNSEDEEEVVPPSPPSPARKRTRTTVAEVHHKKKKKIVLESSEEDE
ncbi:DBP [Snake adenovirus 1]|uniref:DNA-binding protein n=1 Tax=Snake adenovirus serotype 1 TaxID=189830 RepID=DNB2_ADES1|nr:DBP [Snake adenovirus 1]Q8JN65.1 RecName: Full=DNA-binding protein; Short=DBP; AltName: Full=Early 2A protein; AltName: Full=Early E2A DNA-binding protein [Snake adenovirus 1]AAL92454.1 DBP [Snake adenovirus 1]